MLADRNSQMEAHRGLTQALDKSVVDQWEAMCVAWEQDAFPKQVMNPFEIKGSIVDEVVLNKTSKDIAMEFSILW